MTLTIGNCGRRVCVGLRRHAPWSEDSGFCGHFLGTSSSSLLSMRDRRTDGVHVAENWREVDASSELLFIQKKNRSRREMMIYDNDNDGRATIHCRRNEDDHLHNDQQHHHSSSPFSYECTIDNYDRALSWCHEIITSGPQHSTALFSLRLSSASQQFEMPFESLHSLFRNVHVSYMKRASHTLRSSTMRHVKSYLNGCSILDLAKKANCPPTLMARMIVENVIMTGSTTCTTTAESATFNTSSNLTTARDATCKKRLVSEAIRYPEKNIGCASTSLLPEYLFSENAGRGGKRKKKEDNHDIHNDMHDDGTQQIPLSRLSLEVREAVDLDPMYGKSETHGE